MKPQQLDIVGTLIGAALFGYLCWFGVVFGF